MIKSKFLKVVVISSVVIALYGMAPVYFLDKNPKQSLFMGFIVICFLTGLFWLINIWLDQKTKLNRFWFYFLTYLIILTIAVTFFYVTSNFRQHPPGSIVYAIGAGLAINTIIIIIMNSINVGEKKQAAEQEVQRLSIMNMEAQQIILMQQLQPHFLFNALSTLKALIKTNSDEAENYALELSEFLRYTINSHNSKLVMLKDEISFAENYLKLQKVRFGKAIDFEVNIQDEYLSYHIPVYGIQLLVENAIKHNAFSIHNPLRISIFTENNILIVSNIKIKPIKNSDYGIGLTNLNERYRLITGNEIEIINNENEFKVYLTLIKQ